MSLRFILAVVLVLCLPMLLPAQYNNRTYGKQNNNRQNANMQPVEIQGTIQGWGKAGIVVVDGNNQTWRVAISNTTQIQVTGTTTADTLRSGLIVEFTAAFDNRGALQEKVGELTVTSLTAQKQIGVLPDGGGLGDDQGGLDANNAGGQTAKRVRAKGASSVRSAGKYHVVGRLLIRNGALGVQPGGGTLQIQLADDAKIKINMADFTAVKQGYTVSVSGMMWPNRLGVAQALQVKVTLPEPPGAKKEPAAKPDEKKPAKPEEKDKDKDKDKGKDSGQPEAVPGK